MVEFITYDVKWTLSIHNIETNQAKKKKHYYIFNQPKNSTYECEEMY